MFDKLEDLLQRFEEILNELSEPSVTNDQKRFTALMKEQSDLTPIVDAYKEYKQCKQDIEDSLVLLDEETDEDMREMLKEELATAKDRVEELENKMKILLLLVLLRRFWQRIQFRILIKKLLIITLSLNVFLDFRQYKAELAMLKELC